ncbi:uncharacterized protein [Antedon mediterranea]|uniref:uncharacterized protein n=1 Tax=Antedon mediterranea TaxID=105859 RepID=UPI003AF6D320
MSIIERLSKRIKSYLVTLAYFPGRFGVNAAKHVLGETSTAEVKQNAIFPIYNRSLIEKDGQLDRFYFHGFVQEYVDANFSHLRDNVTTRERFCEFFIDVVRCLTPEMKPEKLFPLFNQDVQNIDKLLKEAVNCSDTVRYEKFIQLACDADYLLINVLPKHSAVKFYEACVNSSKLQGTAYQHGMMLMHYGTALGNIKGNYICASDIFMQAKASLLQAIEELKDAKEPANNMNHSKYTDIQSECTENQSIYTENQSKYTENQSKYTENQSKYTENQSKYTEYKSEYTENQSTVDEQRQAREALARLYTSMGWNLHMQSNEREAIENLQIASKMQDELDVKLSRHGGSTMARLGGVHTFIGDLKSAKPYIEASLRIRKQLFGEHPATGETYNYFGLFYQRSPGSENEATKYFKMSLRTKQHFNKAPSRDKVISINNVAMEHAKRSNYDDALKLLDDAYTMQHRLGLNHHDTSLIQNNRGKVYAMMGEYTQSENSFKEALRLRRRMLTNEHTSTAGTLHQLGETLLKAKKFTQAVERFKEALAIRRRVLQQHLKNRGIAETLQCLGQAYKESGQEEDAKEMKKLLDKELCRLDSLKCKIPVV